VQLEEPAGKLSITNRQ